MIDPESLWTTLFGISGGLSTNPVVGRINGTRFRIQKRQVWRNVFAPFFYGTFQPDAQGTRIEGHFGMHPAVTGIVVAFLIVGLILSVRNLMVSPGVMHSFWDFPLAPIVGLVVLVGVGKVLSLRDADYLIEFLKIALTAQ